MSQNEIFLWGERMPVSSSDILQIEDKKFPLYHVQASDDTRALLLLCMEQMEARQEHLDRYILKKLKSRGLKPHYRGDHGHKFLDSVEPAYSHLAARFGSNNVGVVVLVNGEEPGRGSLALSEMHAEKGDIVQVIYKIANETSDKAAGVSRLPVNVI